MSIATTIIATIVWALLAIILVISGVLLVVDDKRGAGLTIVAFGLGALVMATWVAARQGL